MHKKFLPTNFEQDVKKVWDCLAQREHESVPRYVTQFLSVLLKVTPFKKINDEEKMQKSEAGLQENLQKAMKLYPRHNLREMMESAKIAVVFHGPQMVRNLTTEMGLQRRRTPAKSQPNRATTTTRGLLNQQRPRQPRKGNSFLPLK